MSWALREGKQVISGKFYPVSIVGWVNFLPRGNRYWNLMCPSIVRSTLCPTIFRKIQRNFYDYQFHIRGDNRSAKGHIGSAGWSSDINPGVLPPCPLSHALDRAVCSDNVLPILEEHLARSSFPVPILHCHKSAIRSFQGHDNHYMRAEYTVPFPPDKFQSCISSGVLLRSTEEPGRLWQLHNNSESLCFHLR